MYLIKWLVWIILTFLSYVCSEKSKVNQQQHVMPIYIACAWGVCERARTLLCLHTPLRLSDLSRRVIEVWLSQLPLGLSSKRTNYPSFGSLFYEILLFHCLPGFYHLGPKSWLEKEVRLEYISVVTSEDLVNFLFSELARESLCPRDALPRTSWGSLLVIGRALGKAEGTIPLTSGMIFSKKKIIQLVSGIVLSLSGPLFLHM